MSRGDEIATPEQRLARKLAASGATSVLDRTLASYSDTQDPLQDMRKQFNFPVKQRVWPKASRDGSKQSDDAREPSVYMAGNSLGLMPKLTPKMLQEELDVWSTA